MQFQGAIFITQRNGTEKTEKKGEPDMTKREFADGQIVRYVGPDLVRRRWYAKAVVVNLK